LKACSAQSDVIKIINDIEVDMKSRQILKGLGRKKYLAVAIPLIMAAQAQAIEFYGNGIEANLDSQISIGSSWRMENSSENLSTMTNNNNGDNNYEKNDTFSQIFKGSHDLQVSYENFGALVRGKYWYDAELENDDALDDSNNHDLAKFSGAEILDAFVYGEFEVMDMPLDVRLGKQVLSWGESTFLQGGINSTNPYDVSAFRRPGATLKEGLIPVNMAFASLGLTEELSVEAFYMLEFRETVIEGCGTFFSTNDYAGEGCGVVVVDSGDDGIADTADDLSISRHTNDLRRPDADGQFGVALRYLSEALDTEFGFYAMNIHSQVPLVSGDKAIVDEATIYGALYPNGFQSAQDASDLGDVIAAVGVAGGFPGSTPTNFYVEYPEDIQMAGLSFATNIATMSVSGEISHKRNVPLQINDDQLILTGLTADYIVEILGDTSDPALVESAAVEDGTPSDGYRSFEVSQAQITAIKLFDQVLGANRYALVGEAGYTFIHGFDDSDDAKFKFAGRRNDDGTYDNTTTQSSWGYRVRVVGQYSDVFAGVSVTPTLSWNDDVKGYSPRPGGNFREGTEKLGFSLKADYQNTYSAALSFTKISGGTSQKNADRDYASLTLGMQY